MLTKTAALAAIRSTLQAELETLVEATRLARDEATGAESRPENQYDTRALEASYLAAGQGARLETLRRLVAWFAQQDGGRAFERVAAGALVHLESEVGAERWVFVAPTGGLRARAERVDIAVVSPESQLGRALLDLEADDAAEVHGPRGTIEWVITSVQ